MRMFDGFIFDLDGTLASTNKIIFASFNFVIKKYLGKEYTDEEIISLFGPTEDTILKKFTGNQYPQARKDYYHFYEMHHDKMVTQYPQLIKIIKKIKNQNIPLGIFTGKGKESTNITLKKINAYKYFDLIITGDDVAEHKPHPEGINKFIEKFGIKNERVLMIGDAPTDIKAAKSANVKIASVLWDSYSRSLILNENNFDYVFHTIAEFKNFINEQLSY
ncbi:MAG: HAD-IA family hydrolase [Ignavibacteriales bacterium]|nr:HAD-IA family hydrolase [Ignavibacteriales bacterium]